ncbi:MAG: asparaginase [Thermoanaerobaculia bacterium]|nr:asparaginase [Thermoanaerobaculia bacterium]
MAATEATSGGVFVIYTGGTIGSAPRDPGDPDSPQKVVPWDDLMKATPELEDLKKKGCHIGCHSFPKPLDSCNVGPAEWAEMAQVIADNYEKYNGFVILHGTDTMVYSASALSFMLRDLGKPVVLTGAQRSALVDARNDATQNVITSILIANPAFSGLPVVPEVTIFLVVSFFVATARSRTTPRATWLTRASTSKPWERRVIASSSTSGWCGRCQAPSGASTFGLG